MYPWLIRESSIIFCVLNFSAFYLHKIISILKLLRKLRAKRNEKTSATLIHHPLRLYIMLQLALEQDSGNFLLYVGKNVFSKSVIRKMW